MTDVEKEMTASHPKRLGIVGPVAVGKSTVASIVADQLDMEHIDLDAHRQAEGLSVTFLDLRTCVSPIIEQHDRFLLDIGGDTVFRSRVDNEDRMRQVLWLKNSVGVKFILLRANEAVLAARYAETGAARRDYKHIYAEWCSVGEPNWTRLVDPEMVFDASNQDAGAIATRILSALKKQHQILGSKD